MLETGTQNTQQDCSNIRNWYTVHIELRQNAKILETETQMSVRMLQYDWCTEDCQNDTVSGTGTKTTQQEWCNIRD